MNNSQWRGNTTTLKYSQTMQKGDNKTIYFCLRTKESEGLSMNVRYSTVPRTHKQTLFTAKLFTFMVVKRKKLPASAAPSSFYILSREECKDEGSILTEEFFFFPTI